MSELFPAWLRGAAVAPSAHNTQPWRFTPLPDGRIGVGWVPDRALPVGDPTNRDLFLALGAAVESARLRALAEGVALRFEPAPADAERLVGWLAADTRPGPPEPAELALADRTCHNRFPTTFVTVWSPRPSVTAGASTWRLTAPPFIASRRSPAGRRPPCSPTTPFTPSSGGGSASIRPLQPTSATA